MNDIENKKIQMVDKAIKDFERALKDIEKNSTDALALAIFINGCLDTNSFASNKYSALVHYQKARSAANCIEELLAKNRDIEIFKRAISNAHESLLMSGVINPDLCLQH